MSVVKVVALSWLNAADKAEFVRICGPFFEHSPWISERTYASRPFASRVELHSALMRTIEQATTAEQTGLICAHPDLVGRLAREGELTRESTGEQQAAGLGALTAEEIASFDRFNAAYRAKFGFPFVICARENKAAAILAAFPVRLENSIEQEHRTAISEIGKIAWLRLQDAVSDDSL